MIKKRLSIVIMTLVMAFVPLIANAGDYTSTDPNKNSSYNRDNAETYQNNYAPVFAIPYEGTGSGTSSGKYYNFYNDGGDCTNFASQMLKYGGMSYQGTNRDSTSSWFYNGTYPNYSSTWTSAHFFRQHWGNVNGSGGNRAYSYKVYTVASALQNWSTIWKDMYRGDIVQHAYPDGNTYHSQEIYRYLTTNYELRFSQHSTESKWFYKDHDLKAYLNGLPSNQYFFTYKIKKGE